MVAETKRTPRARKQAKAETPVDAVQPQPDSTPKVESNVANTNIQAVQTPVPAPAPAPAPPAPTVTDLEAAAKELVSANLRGVPLTLTRGVVSGRQAAPSSSMSYPPWVGSLSGHLSSAGRTLSPDVLFLALQQAIPVPSAPEFQTFGAEHFTGNAGRLQKPLTITLAEGRMQATQDDLTFMDQIRDALLDRDLFVLSLDRLRLHQRSNSGKPMSDNIVLEAYDPATGGLVWKNPRISVSHAIAACLMGSALPSPAPTVRPIVAFAPAPAPALAAPAAPALPEWFMRLKASADDYGVPPEKLAHFIAKGRGDALFIADVTPTLEAGIALATKQVEAIMAGANPAPAPAPSAPAVAPAAPAPVPVAPAPVLAPSTTEGVAAALGLAGPATPPPPPAPKPVRPKVIVAEDLPEFLGLEHLTMVEWRPKVQERIVSVLSAHTNKTANARQIREGLGLPVGCGPKGVGGDLEKIGNALKRFLNRLEADGVVVGAGATQSKTYQLL